MKRLVLIFLVFGTVQARADTLGTPPAPTISPRVLDLGFVDRCVRVIGAPGDPDERMLLEFLAKARAYIAGGKADAALDDADRLVAAEPNSGVALIYRAIAKHALKDWNGAIKDLDDALDRNQSPKSITALA